MKWRETQSPASSVAARAPRAAAAEKRDELSPQDIAHSTFLQPEKWPPATDRPVVGLPQHQAIPGWAASPWDRPELF
jgi:hypothetical protein